MRIQTNCFLLAIMLLAVTACKRDQTAQLPKISTLAAASETVYGYATDSSGLVKIVVVTNQAIGLTNEVSVTIPDDYVLIGGGAHASSSPDYFITASYPNDSLTTWRTKFYQQPRLNNIIYGFAVGLKLEGVTKAQLKASMQLGVGIDSASVDSNYVLIGGGTRVTYAGNGKALLTTKPDGNSWYSVTKNYLPVDSAVINTYAIGILKNIPGFGALNVQKVAVVEPLTNNRNSSVIIKLDDKWVTACPGAELSGTTIGRRLTTLYPLTRSVSIFSIRDSSNTNGSTAGFMLKIRKGN